MSLTKPTPGKVNGVNAPHKPTPGKVNAPHKRPGKVNAPHKRTPAKVNAMSGHAGPAQRVWATAKIRRNGNQVVPSGCCG
jgi:hypothetical protein